MGAVGIEEAATVSPQVLDELERGHGSLSDDLNSALQCVGLRVRRQVERYALPDQNQAAHDGHRQKNPKQSADEIHPEVAQGRRMLPREASDKSDPNSQAGISREEILRDQANELGQIAKSGFARVSLPGCGRRE